MPVAAPVQQPQAPMVQVTCPPGISAGMDLQVQTEAGLMRVKVPAGIEAGGTFLMRLPAAAPAGAPVQGRPMQPPMPYQQPLPPQQPAYAGYPGQPQQPRQVVVQQQAPQTVHVVHASPYYGGGYYGYDPFFSGTMGLMGGMLIADAMFW